MPLPPGSTSEKQQVHYRHEGSSRNLKSLADQKIVKDTQRSSLSSHIPTNVLKAFTKIKRSNNQVHRNDILTVLDFLIANTVNTNPHKHRFRPMGYGLR